MITTALTTLWAIADAKERAYISSTLSEYHHRLKEVAQIPHHLHPSYYAGLVYEDYCRRLASCHQREKIVSYLRNYLHAYYHQHFIL